MTRVHRAPATRVGLAAWARLERENASLRARITELERAFLGQDFMFPPAWDLTGAERQIVGLLLSRPFARYDQLMAALYRHAERQPVSTKIVTVLVCRIRRKLADYGVTIRTIWGVGYAIDEPFRGALSHALRSPARYEAIAA